MLTKSSWRWYVDYIHANLDLPSRRFHHPRRFGPRCKHPPQVASRCTASSSRPKDVRGVGSWLGELAAGIYCVGDVSDSVGFLQVR